MCIFIEFERSSIKEESSLHVIWNILYFHRFCVSKCSLWRRIKPPTYVESVGFIALAYGRDRREGKDAIEWKSAKMELLGSRKYGSIPADIEIPVRFGKREPPMESQSTQT